jgi:hypothetical protein
MYAPGAVAVGNAWALILRQPKRQAKKTAVMYFVLFIGTDAPYFVMVIFKLTNWEIPVLPVAVTMKL